MSKHTPGPWLYEFSEFGGYDMMTCGMSIGPTSTLGLRTIASLDGAAYGQDRCASIHNEAKEKMTADARLISAAPDMAEALKLCVAVIENGADDLGAKQAAISALQKAGVQ